MAEKQPKKERPPWLKIALGALALFGLAELID
jgi:hypothetical protein